MTLYDLEMNWHDISYEKKIDALKALADFLSRPCQKDDQLLNDLLGQCYDLEADDYFGTEGLKF